MAMPYCWERINYKIYDSYANNELIDSADSSVFHSDIAHCNTSDCNMTKANTMCTQVK